MKKAGVKQRTQSVVGRPRGGGGVGEKEGPHCKPAEAASALPAT